MFIAWETFLEETLANLMAGILTISGSVPVRYVSPLSDTHAKTMIVGTRPYFDFANHDNVRTVAAIYFKDGVPIEPHLRGIVSELSDLKTIRNACAHFQSTTQMPLEFACTSDFRRSKDWLFCLSAAHLRRPAIRDRRAVFLSYKNKLIVTAELIATG